MEDRIMFDAAAEVDPAELQVNDSSDAFTPAVDAGAGSSTESQSDDSKVGAAGRRELVIVDTSVENYQQLVDDILEGNDPSRQIEVVTLDSTANGIAALSSVLARHTGLDAVHIVSHGTDSAVKIGDTWLTSENISTFQSQISGWEHAFADEGDLLLYGCNLGESTSGRALVDSLSSMTNTDVAASIDATGYAPRGGDWDLEYAVGMVETAVAFSAETQASWTGILAVGPNVTLSVPGSVPLGEDVNFTITFSNTGAAGEVGFGPYIDFLIPHLGEDGVYDGTAYTDTPDGLDVAASGAITYLGQAVTYQVLTFGDDDGAFNDNGTPGDLSDDTGTGTIGVLDHPFFEDVLNESQLLTANGAVTGGTYTLTFNGDTTGPIAHNASAATIQAALEALSGISAGDVSVTGGALPGSDVIVEFTGSLAQTDVSQLVVDDSALVGGYFNSYTLANGDSASQALKVYGNAGEKLVVVELPFGSFTPEQPAATISVNATMSNLADLAVPLNITARGGFRYGADALDNPATDPSILSDTQNNAHSWVVASSVTPTLLEISKTYNGPEQETATGPNYVRQWTVNVNIPDGQTIANLDIFDDLPNNIVFVSLDSITSVDGTTTFTTNVPAAANNTSWTGSNGSPLVNTTAPQNGQSLVVTADSITGTGSSTDVSVTFSYYVAEFDADSNRVIPINGEDDTTSSPDSRSHNNSRAIGDFTPIDTRDSGGTDNAVADPPGDEDLVDDKSIAVQKSVVVVDGTGTPIGGLGHPSDILRYTITFQISDFYTFGDLVLTDLFSDGQRFYDAAGFEPIFSVSDFNATHSNVQFDVHVGAETAPPGAPASANFIVDQIQIDNTDNAGEDGVTPDGSDGTTTITMELSEALALIAGEDGILQGGLSNGGTNLGAATGTITFYTQIQDDFSDTFPSGDRSVDQGDVLTNSITIAGSVRENQEDNGTTFGTLGNEDDGSGASISIEQGVLTKSIFAINGSTTFGNPVEVAPGDTVTYRLTYTLPTTDFEGLVLTDFFPLPVFTVGDPDADDVAGPAWSFDANAATNSFTAGTVEILSTDTFYDIWDNADDGSLNDSVAPTLAIDTAANSLTLDYGTFDNPTFQSSQIDILLTVTVQDDPFADGLFLTNTAQADEGTTNGSPSTQVDLIQIQLTEPVVAEIRKGIVDTSKTTAFSGTDGGNTVTFTETSATADFTGSLNSDWLTNVPLDTLTNDLDAGDTVRFALVLENIGSSRKGAFDITVADVLPSGFTYVANSLQVYDGFGDSMTYTGSDTDLFAAGITLDDPGPTAAQGDGTDAGALDEFHATSGRNVAVLIYDVTIDTSAEPPEQLDNTGRLIAYAGTEGGQNHVVTPPEAIASVTIANPTITKTLNSSEIDDSAGAGNNVADEAVIGEIVTYQIVIDVPEGTLTNFQVQDLLDAGLAFMDGDSNSIIDATIVASSGLSTSIGTFTDVVNNATVTNQGSGAENQGRRVTFDFGTITNSNTDDGVTEQITITYDAVVINRTSNDAGDTRNNTATLTWNGGSLDDNAQNVTILEPTVTVQKTASVAQADVGDTVTFTLLVTNTGGTNGADAFDVSLSDALPSGFTYVNASLTHDAGVAPTTLSESAGTITVDWSNLAFGQSSTITFDATANGTFSTSGETNVASIEWTSLSGDVTTSRSTFNTLAVERTGDPTDPAQAGADNDYNASDSAFVDFPISPTKSILTTTESHTSDSTADTAGDPRPVAIGELVTYELRVQVGEGSLTGVTFRDLLTDGMTLLPGTVTFEIIADANMTVAADLNGANTAPIALPAGRISVTSGATQTIDFDLGNITNNDNDADVEELVITFDALVANSTANNAAAAKTNSFDFIENSTNHASSNTVHAQVVEPLISNVNKQVTSTNGDGSQVTYEITFSNTGTATAFDTVALDTLPTELALQTGSIGVATTGTVNGINTTNSTATALDVRIDEIGVGATVTITYTVDVTFGGSAIQNAANVTYTSLPGTNGTGSATPGNPGDTDGERTGSGVGTNDYLDSDDAYIGSIGDRLWYDIDSDGVLDTGEVGLPGVTVNLTWFGPDGVLGGGDDVNRSTTTDASGNYAFTGVAAGNYTVSVDTGTLPNGINVATFDLDGIGTANTSAVTLVDTPAGVVRTDVDFAYTGSGSIGDTVFYDYDAGATQNNGEPGIEGVTVTLTWEGFLPGFADGDEIVYVLATDANGNYDFTDLPSGQFSVDVDPSTVDFNQDSTPDTVVLTTANDPLAVTLAAAQDFNTADFGYHGTGTIGDLVFFDHNGNGTQDGSEPGYAGLTVTLDMDFDGDGTTDYTISTTTDSNGNYSFANLPPGDYDVTVTPPANATNTLDPDGGANSTSALTLADGQTNNAQDFAYQGTGSIGDRVWLDLDGDGVQDALEPGINGLDVRLDIDLDGNGSTDMTLTTTTLANGAYQFDDLPAGDYTVTVVNPLSGTNPSFDSDGTASPHTSDVSLTGGSPNSLAQDFGYQGTGSIGDTVFWDKNGNGTQDTGEAGLFNVPVTLQIDFDQNGSVDATLNTTTDGAGNYSFANLPAVDYTVVVTQPAGTTQIADADGLGTPNQSSLTLAAGENNTSQDFAYNGNGGIGDTIFWDVNNNGALDAPDRGLFDVEVTLAIDIDGDATDDYTETVRTDINGNYAFSNLIAGDYSISVTPSTVPGGMSSTPTVDSDGTGTAHTSDVTLAANTTNNDQDFGYTGTATLGDFVWLDTNGDGIQDAGEPGLGNVDVTITWFGNDGSFGTPDDESFTITTDANGNYDFPNLAAGTYRVDVDETTAPSGTGVTTGNDSHDVVLAAGADHNSSDFGFNANGTIGDFVFYDFDGDGVYTAGTDAPYVGITVTLTGDIDNDSVDETLVTTTDVNGNYTFTGLPHENYTITLTPPGGTSPTVDATGPADNQSTVTLSSGSPTSDTQDFGLTGTGSIGDTIFYDIDGDGGQDAGEPGIVGVTVQVDVDLDGDGNPDFTATTTTDQSGNYSFTNIPAGTHTITVTTPIGSNPTTDHDGTPGGDNASTFNLAAGETNNDQDFGFLGTGSIGDVVFWDADADGVQDAGEPGLPGVTVELDIDFDQNGSVDHTLTTTTGPDGSYTFGNLSAGDYDVRVTQPAGTTQTFDADGIGTANVSSLTLGDGENNTDQDFGYRGNGSIGDTVFWDVNNDGAQDVGDRGLQGVDVTLEIDVNGDSTIDYTTTATTDNNGNYQFDNLLAGDYTISVTPATVPGGMGANPTFDSDGTATPHTSDVTLAVDENNADQDFGYTGTATLGDRVFLDTDGDGVQDAVNEPGLANVDVQLTWFGPDSAFGTADDEVLTTTTDANGDYDFANLPSGDFRVDVIEATSPPTSNLTTGNDTHDVNLTPGEDHDSSDFGFQGTGSIGDFVFYDFNGDGIENGDDVGYAGVTITGTGDIDGDGIDETFTAVTDANGDYNLPGLPEGTYTVTLTPPAGTSPTFDADGTATPNVSVVTLDTANPSSDTQDFGLTGSGTVGDTIFFDEDGDGVQGASEVGIPGVTVTIDVDLDGDGNPDFTTSAVTDQNGNYSFPGIPAGQVTVTVTTPTGSNPTTDHDGTPGGDNTSTFNLAAGETNNDQDFGFLGTGSIGDTIYWDVNNNGVQDASEVGLFNVPVQLDIDFDQNGSVDHSLNAATDINGNYAFAGLMVGDYDVIVTQPVGTTQTDDPDGGNDNQSSLTLGDGENNTQQDFGYRGDSALGDIVFWDVNNNGAFDAGIDRGLAGVDVTLTIDFDGDSTPDYTDTIQTDATGNYAFTNLVPGDYTVTVNPATVPGGLANTPTVDGDGIGTPHTSDVTLGSSQTNNAQDFGYTGTGSIGDTVFWDANNNGVQDVGEPGLPSVPIALDVDIDQNGSVDFTFNTTTDTNGNFTFANLPPVDYDVRVTQPAGTTPTFDADGIATANVSSLTLANGENNTDQDFGYRGNGSIGDIVFFDYVGDGGPFNPAQNDRGMAGVDVTLQIDVNGDSTPDYSLTVPTDATGNYQFNNLIPGTYTITTDPSDLPDQMGNNPTFDADGTATANTSTLVLTAGENNTAQDFGYHATPDYNITKSDGQLSVVTGQSISYTVTVRNDGTLFGQNIVVNDTFPTNILTNVTATDGGIVNSGAGTITWNATTTPALAIMDVGEQVTFTITADVVAILDGNNQPLVNAVSVTDDAFNGLDPNLADNSAQDTDQIVDITTLKNVTGLVANGDNWDIAFELIVENTGSVQLENLTLFDDLTSQFGSALISVTTPTIDASGMTGGGTPPVVNTAWTGNTSLDLLDPAFTSEVLMPGERFAITFTATLDPDATGTSSTLSNSANGGGSDNTTDPGNPTTVTDLSDSGTDVASTNPGAPGDTGGESDATPLYIPDIAIAKQQGTTTQDAITHNWSVNYTFFVENVGTVSLDSLSVADDIATEFGNAFVAVQANSLAIQNFVGTGTAPTINSAWEGDTSLEMLNAAGAQLNPGDAFEIVFTVEIDPDGVDGISQALSNQATTSGRGLDENGLPLQDSGGAGIIVSDNSDSGANPNGINPNDPGDAGTSNDPTMLVIPEIAAAKRLVAATPTGAGGNRDLTYDVVIRNVGTVDLTDLTLAEDLNGHFAAAFVAVSTPPAIVASNALQDPTLNPGWDGNLNGVGDAAMFGGTDGMLLPGQEITIRFTVEVDIDQLNSGSSNQVDVSGFYDATPGVPGNQGTVTDLSDTGTDPATTNPGQPGDTGGFDDPTLIPAIGIAKNHGDFVAVGNNFDVPITLVVQNLGATDLNNLSLIEDLRAEFGAAFVAVSAPSVDNSGMAIPANGPGVNAAWNSDTSLNVLDGSGVLQPGDQFTVTFTVTVDPDNTGTSAALSNQATITASDPGNPTAVVQDISDSGSDPAQSNIGEPGDTGSADDSTPLQIPDVGLAKQITNATQLGLEFHLTIELTLENTGTVDIDDLQLFDDLAIQYGVNFGRIVSPPQIVASTAASNPNLNPSYTGDTSQNMFDGASGLLRPGQSITVELVVEVVAAPGQSEATLENQAHGGGTALDENGLPLTDEAGTPLAQILDDSDSGADPNGSNPGAPGDTGTTDDPTSQDLTFFTFDAFNDFSNERKGLWEKFDPTDLRHDDRLLTKEISTLAPEPIFSGSARPGTQIVGRAYDSAGILIGEEISFADVGGNWMMQFHEIVGQDHARFEFIELAGIGNTFAPHGDIYGYLGEDARDNDYASLEPWTPYGHTYEFTAVYRATAGNSLATMHRANQHPLGLGQRV